MRTILRISPLLLIVLISLFVEGYAFLGLFKGYGGRKGQHIQRVKQSQEIPYNHGVKIEIKQQVKEEQKGKKAQESHEIVYNPEVKIDIKEQVKEEQKGKKAQESQEIASNPEVKIDIKQQVKEEQKGKKESHVQESQEIASDADGDILYPFGEEVGDKTTPIEDDGTSGKVSLNKEFMFFGKSYKSLYVNNNGVMSFNKEVSQYTPDAFPLTEGQVFVTPFWGDVDVELGGKVYYRETEDPALLERISRDMKKHLPELDFKATWAFIATWYDVVFYGAAVKKRNTFQSVLTSGGQKYLAILNYKDIQWATGTASEGDAYTGTGGIPAQAGFDSGDEKNYFNIPGSRTNEVLKIQYTSNVNQPGRWVFIVDKFEVPGGCTIEAKFANEDEEFYMESCCKTKCQCKNGKVTCIEDVCPKTGTCEESGSFYTCKMPSHGCN